MSILCYTLEHLKLFFSQLKKEDKKMKKVASVCLIIMLAGVIYCFANLKSGETEIPTKSPESPAIKSPPVVAPKEAAQESGILADIKRARQMLEKEEAGFSIKEKKFKGQWEVENPKYLLAIRHTNGEIKIVRVDPKAGEWQPQEYVIDWGKLNGVNTKFTVIYPENSVVLAVKRVVRDPNELFKEVIYTPYSAEIDCQELRDAGMDYLKRTIKEARRQLKQVPSLAHEGRSVAETTSEEQSLVLAIIEHIDPDRLLQKVPVEKLMGEVLAVIGANQGMAYRFSVSSANARGLWQFIPPTYALIKDKYPEASLHQDFIEGMNNHLNAAKASMLLFDSDLSYFKEQKVFAGNDLTLGKQLASAYNCGAKRTAKEIKAHKNMWERKVPHETRLYLKKFNAAWDSLFGA
jgi:hypothetical protein